MKKILLGLGLMLAGMFAQAQNGLENIVVEKYYVSNANDQTISAGGGTTLPTGSVTFRVYADMLPGYNFQALYGVATHELKIATTTNFFNEGTFGGSATNGIVTSFARQFANILDSYLSVGGSTAGKFGVLKTEDTDGSIGNTSSMMANVDPSAGISPLVQDGGLTGSPVAVTFVGLSAGAAPVSVFETTGPATGATFSTFNGSVAALGGTAGPTAANRILIGQFTTTGVFSFELNIQIGTPTGGVQNFVAKNPTGAEISIPSLMQTLNAPNAAPTVSITAPAGGSSYIVGQTVTIDATAADADGSVTGVEFFVNGVSIGVDNTSPYSVNWTSTVGNKALTARATDDLGSQTTSAAVNIVVGNNVAPTVSLTAPANGAVVNHPAVVTIDANAADTDGSITNVEFLVDGVVVGTDNTSPYSFNWNTVLPLISGSNTVISARATDNFGAVTTSATRSITIIDPNALPYRIGSSVNTCVNNIFCLPLLAVATIDNVIGYDVVLSYNKAKVYPTGVITVGNALVNPNFTSVAQSVDTAAGKINISVFFNGSAPTSSEFAGSGEVFCVQFTKKGAFAFADTAIFSATLQESYANQVLTQFVENGRYITYRDTAFRGALSFWFDNSPIGYDGSNLITNIYGNNMLCNSQSATAVQPDVAGNFTYNINNGPSINIEKNILNTTDVQPVINGFDAFLVRKVLVNDASFVPSVYQMVAMDVNMDGFVSAGDLSQLNERTVLRRGEFAQAWNYNTAGVSNGQASKDWLFIDNATLSSNPGFVISSTYPSDNGVGYSKSRVPVISFCKVLPIQNYTGCASIQSETFKGVLIGDVSGSFSTTVPNNLFRTSSKEVIFDLDNAIIENGVLEVAVKIDAQYDVNSMDFSLALNNNLTFMNAVNNMNNMEVMSHVNTADNTLRLTSNSLQRYVNGVNLVTVRFATTATNVSDVDFGSVQAYLNGERVGTGVSGAAVAVVSNVYPNPAASVLNVEVSEDAQVQLLDMSGRIVMVDANAVAGQNLVLDVTNLVDGVYLVKMFNDNFVSVKKVVVRK